ncbi:CMD domain-containing protein [Kluyvera intermedia]|uniref:carboxymuconolactone decarboxylase family protein n=1 Tax=Kluyvera intermedia TaxID=61648 RepID=UPI0034A5990D
MEPRQVSGKNHWYHETQSRTQHSDVMPLVPEAAYVDDRFLLDLTLPDALLSASQTWLRAARRLANTLFPNTVTTNRLHTFSAYDRLSTALTVAQVSGVQRLCNHYAARLAPLPGPDSSRESNHRLAQITQYARQLASSPSIITPRARQQLDDVGLTLHDIITINQVVGFVGFQARIIALFQAHLGFPVRWIPGMPVQEDADAELFSHDGSHWRTDLNGIEPHQANTPQGEALNRWQHIPELEALAPVLAQEDALLDGLGELIDTLSFAHPLQPLSSLIPARINGSVSCFNYYSTQWQGASGLPEAVRNGERALQAWSHHYPCERVVAQATQLLTRAPDRFSAAQLAPLMEHGLSTPDAVTLLAWSALSGWLNRLRIALGCGQQVT